MGMELLGYRRNRKRVFQADSEKSGTTPEVTNQTGTSSKKEMAAK